MTAFQPTEAYPHGIDPTCQIVPTRRPIQANARLRSTPRVRKGPGSHRSAIMNDAGLEAALGAGLMTTPLWALVLHDVSMLASTVAAICGAIIGVHAVLRLWRQRRQGQDTKR